MKVIGYFKSPIISISLHIPGHTVPLYDQGFILKINNILEMYPSDCTSYFLNGKKYSNGKIKQVYSIEDLIIKTPKGKHNECFVTLDDIDIIGGYTYKRTPNKKFINFCRDRNLIINSLT